MEFEQQAPGWGLVTKYFSQKLLLTILVKFHQFVVLISPNNSA
jgi:hypothetical protein